MRSMELGDEEDQRLEEIWITILRRLSRTISRTPSGIPEYHHGPPTTPRVSLRPLPHLAGVYASSDLAATIAGDLIGRDLPVQVERHEAPPPYSQVIGDTSGTLVHGHTGPVWVVRTDYRNSKWETGHGPAEKDLVPIGTRGDQTRRIP